LSKRQNKKQLKNAKILFNRELHVAHNAKKYNNLFILICDNLCIILPEFLYVFKSIMGRRARSPCPPPAENPETLPDWIKTIKFPNELLGCLLCVSLKGGNSNMDQMHKHYHMLLELLRNTTK
jgi:hypothetical protein